MSFSKKYSVLRNGVIGVIGVKLLNYKDYFITLLFSNGVNWLN